MLGESHRCGGLEPGNQLTLVISLPILLLTAKLLLSKYHTVWRFSLPAAEDKPWWLVIAIPSQETSPHSSIILTIFVIHLPTGEIPSPVHIPHQRNKPLWANMSKLLIICALCLQAKANIVSNKRKRRSLSNVSLFSQVFLVFFSPERLIKFMQMTLSPPKHANAALVLRYKLTACYKVKFPVLAVQVVVETFLSSCKCTCLFNLIPKSVLWKTSIVFVVSWEEKENVEWLRQMQNCS